MKYKAKIEIIFAVIILAITTLFLLTNQLAIKTNQRIFPIIIAILGLLTNIVILWPEKYKKKSKISIVISIITIIFLMLCIIIINDFI